MEKGYQLKTYQSATSTKTLEDKFKGCIIGAAIGDALGMPTEFIEEKTLKYHYRGRVVKFENPLPNHPCSHLKAGQYTDDTQQITLLTQSLISKGKFDIDDFSQRIAEWGRRCVYEPNYNRFAGSTSLGAALDLLKGVSPYESGKDKTTCGSAMRIAPIGLFYHDQPEELKSAVYVSTIITHNHRVAVDGAMFVAATISNLLLGDNEVESVSKAMVGIRPEIYRPLQFVLKNRNIEPDELAKHVGTSVDVCQTVPMALACFLYSPHNFEETVVSATNLVPGDTDSIASIAGALSGARNGYSTIPQRFIDGLEDKSELEELAVSLFRKSLSKQA